MMRKYIFLLPLILLVFHLASCDNHEEVRMITPLTSSPRSTPTLNPTATSTPTATVTLMATRTRHPTATPDISPKDFTTIGKGRLGEIAYSKDGKKVAYIEGARLAWFDKNSGEELGTLKLDGDWHGGLAFSPDGNWILVDNVIGIGVVNTQTQAYTRCCGGGNGPSFGFTFSTDSRYLAYTNADGTTGGPYHFVSVYELDTDRYLETEIDRLRRTQAAADEASFWDWNHSYPVKNPHNYHTMSPPAISPDHQWLSAGYHDSRNDILYAWYIESGEVRLEIPHPAEINAVDISSDGQYLVSGCDDGLVRLFDSRSGKLEKKITGFMARITGVQFSADSNQITVSVADHPAQIYDLNTGQLSLYKPPEIKPDPFLLSLHQQGYADGSGVLFSPDGHTIAIGGQHIQLWDIESQKVVTSLENPDGRLLGWAFSPTGTHLAGLTLNGKILVWETASSQLVLTLKTQLLEPGQVFSASGSTGIGPGIGTGVFTGQGIAFSPDGANIAFGNGNTIELWNIAEAKKVAALIQPETPAYTTRVSFSATGERLYAVINRNQDAQIWDIQTQEFVKQLHLPTTNPNAFSATDLNGSLFARNNYDDGQYWIELWDLETGEMLRISTPNRETEPLRFSPDGSLLMAISKSNLYFWETTTGHLIDWMHLDAAAPGLALSLDNATLALGDDGKAKLWNIAAIRDVLSQNARNPAASPPTVTPWQSDFFPTSTPFATPMASVSESPERNQKAFSPENITKVREIAHFGNGWLEAIIWSPYNQSPTQTLLSAGSQGIITYSTDPLAMMNMVPTSLWMDSIAALNNGEILAAGVSNQTVQVLNMTTGKVVLEILGSGPVKLNTDGTLLVYGDRDGNLLVHDLSKNQPLITLNGLYASQLPVVSPDNRFVAAVNGYETRLGAHQFVRIWDIETGQIVNSWGVSDATITDLSFSADGQFLVGASGGAVWIWDLQDGGTPQTLSIYEPEANGNLTLYHQRITAAAINHDNRILAIGDSERNIWLYGRAYKNKITRLTGHPAPITVLRFSPDGKQLLSLDIDGQLIIWEVATGRMIDKLSTQTGRIQGLTAGLGGNIFAWKNNAVLNLQPRDALLVASTSIHTGTILTVSPTGDWVGVSQRLHMSVWDAATSAFLQRLEGEAGDPFIDHQFEGLVQRGFYKAVFSPDGNQLTTYAPGETWTYTLAADNLFQPEDYQEGSPYAILDEKYGAAATSQDEKWTVTTSRWQPTTLYFYEFDNQINEMTFPDEKRITSLAFSPDSRLVAVGFGDGTIELIDVSAWKSVFKLTGHKGTVNALVFSINGTTLVSAGIDGTIRFWGIQ